MKLTPDRALHLCRHFSRLGGEQRTQLLQGGISAAAIDAETGLAGSLFLPEFALGPFSLVDRIAGDWGFAQFLRGTGPRREYQLVYGGEEWPAGIGTDGVMALSDAREQGAAVTRAERGGAEVWVIEGAERPRTWNVVVVVQPIDRTGGGATSDARAIEGAGNETSAGEARATTDPRPAGFEIVTAFPGTAAPPLPNREYQTEIEFERSRVFWDTHGLLV